MNLPLSLLTSPYGWLAIIGASIMFGFIAWRVILGKSYSWIGLRPLVTGYLSWMAVVLVTSLIFGGMASAALTHSSLSFLNNLLFVLLPSVSEFVPGLSVFGVPLAAFFVRTDRLGFVTATIFVVLILLAIGTLRWSFGLGFPIDALWLFVVPPSIAFIVGVMVSLRRRQ